MYKAERSEGSLGLQSSNGFISAPRLWCPRNHQNQLCWISYRWTFDEFASRYYLLVHSSYWSPMPGDIRGLSMEILKKTITESDKYQVGLTKIFFRPGMVYSSCFQSDTLVGVSREIAGRPSVSSGRVCPEELATKHVSQTISSYSQRYHRVSSSDPRRTRKEASR